MGYFRITSVKSDHATLRHKKVWYDDIYLGYYMPNHSDFAQQGENWNFVSKHKSITSFHTRIEADIMIEVKNQLENP